VTFAVLPDDPCLRNLIFVAGSRLMEKTSPSGSPNQTGRTVLVVRQTYLCDPSAPIIIFDGEGEDTTTQTLKVAGDLRSATLTATVTVLDTISLRIVDFHISLTWKALAKPEFQQTKESFRDPDTGLFILSQSRGFVAPATASGTVMEAGGQNLTPMPSISAELASQNDGILVIQRTR
jgi:hypothetical protein